MVKYLVTTRLEVLESASQGCQVFMVDGTVPGWTPGQIDYHFDHHRQGGADIQIDEIHAIDVDPELQGLFVTTLVDADACVAAAILQIPNELNYEKLQKLRAIAYDCDHLGVPEELSQYADFAAQCVAAMKADSDDLINELDLPKDCKQWSIEQKESYASLAFQRGTEAIIEACKGLRSFPGECGEAEEYWQKVESDTQLLLNENRVTFYRGTLLIDLRGLTNIDCRCGYKAYEWLKINYGHECHLPVCLTIMDRWDNGVKTGLKYTLAVIPLHPKLASIDYTYKKPIYGDSIESIIGYEKNIFERLTEAERKIKPNADGWGGRKTVGGSGWNTPSQLTPKQVIDIVLG